MNDKFTAEEIVVLNDKGWEMSDDNVRAFCSYHKISKYTGVIIGYTFMEDHESPSGGYWEEWSRGSVDNVNDVPSFD